MADSICKNLETRYMKRLILLLLLATPMFSFAQKVDLNLLQGEWVLGDIQSKDSVWVSANPDGQGNISANGKIITKNYEEKKISLVEYMLKSMTCGLTKFVFKGMQFEFYRNNELTFAGKFIVKGNKIILEYQSGPDEKTKENTLVSLSANKLVLASESKEKPVLLAFSKK
jgi:hypothetical protein